MPSHLAHELFARQLLLESVPQEHQKNILPLSALDEAALIVGAQLPDLWYHNRRTRPSGLWISVALHRRGIASFFGELVQLVSEEGLMDASQKKALFIMTLAALSHAVLDRHLHPWINAHSSWESSEDSTSSRYRYRHAMCERFVDIYLLKKQGMPLSAIGDFGKNFATAVEKAELHLPQLSAVLTKALHAVYPKKRNDDELDARIHNGFHDARGFYLWSSGLSQEQYEEDIFQSAQAYRRLYSSAGAKQLSSKGGTPIASDHSEDPELQLRFSSIVHPRLDNTGLERLEKLMDNSQQQLWHDPCTDEPPVLKGMFELYNEALLDAQTLISALFTMINESEIGITIETSTRGEMQTQPLATQVQKLLEDCGFHNGDLRSRPLSDQPCTIHRCKPIDWIALRLEWEGYLTPEAESLK